MGCSLAVYVGHGRSRGWSGYRGFRWSHMENTVQRKPIGTLISFSCSSLKSDKKNSLPFGLQWILSGRACTILASCGSLQLNALKVIGNIFLESVSSPDVSSIDELLFTMNDKIRSLNNPALLKNWGNFRLTGNPFQTFKGKLPYRKEKAANQKENPDAVVKQE